jgi:putative peptidoglycan lipid II flippase
MIITLFGYGAFTETDAVMTSRSLVAYALGLVGFMSVKVLAPAYYARQDLRAPVRIALAALGANLVLNLVLIVPLGHAGLALATTLAATLNGALLFWGLLGRGLYLPLGGWPGLLWRGGVASFIMAVVLFGVSGDAATWMTLSSGERVRWLVWCLTAGAGAYLISLLILGIRPRHLGAGGVESGA